MVGIHSHSDSVGRRRDDQVGLGLASSVTATTYDAAGRVLTKPFKHSSHGLLPSKQSTGLFRPFGHGSKYANGVVTTYTYSATRGWVNTISTVKGATTITSLT
ncbi:MAG: hypothetical protein ABL866_11815 [Devosia sp.]